MSNYVYTTMIQEIQRTMTNDVWKTKIPSPTLDNTTSARTMEHGITKYLPKEVLDYIERNPSEKVSYRGTTPISYSVDFYCYGNKIPLDRIQLQMKLVIWWLTLVQKYAERSCSDLVVSVYLTPLKKKMPYRHGHGEGEGGNPSSKILSPINCNTGLSTRCDMGNSIIIFREEEWFKVFIHESFHYFGLDFAYSQPPMVNTRLKQMFCVSSEIQLYEAYTEFWAEMITIMLYSTIHSDDLSIIIDTEVHHSIGQAKKVLKIQDLTYTDVLAPCTATKSYQEDTNVFAYYVIKTIFLYFHTEFIGWCIDNNPNLLQIHPSELPKLLDWIEEHHKNPKFLTAMENAKSNGNGLRMTFFNI